MDTIIKRMASITAELPIVAKKLFVETSREKGYNAASERDILDAVKPLEIKHGVFSYPVSREIVDDEILQAETEKGTRTTFFTRIKTIYRFVNVDEPTDFIETVTYSEGIDSQDKGSGKAMTYGDKYALMKAYKISTGDDPDKDASTDTHYERLNTAKCSECGRELSVKEAAYCTRNGLKPICYKCQQNLKRTGSSISQTDEDLPI